MVAVSFRSSLSLPGVASRRRVMELGEEPSSLVVRASRTDQATETRASREASTSFTFSSKCSN
uniref:Uncharacterized protein n=1 Tax=Arundo donax TaxID=35708 RepID=A0A0A8YS53_ARUDO